MWYSGDMKRVAVLSILTVFSFFLLTSCTHQSEQVSVVDETVSIRYAVKQVKNAVSWTAPVEPDALSEDSAGLVNDIRFYPAAGFAVMTGRNAVYPDLEEFGSLDTSEMSRKILSGLNDFLGQLSKKTLTFNSSFFDKPYEGVVILYDASLLDEITGWKIGKPFISSGESALYEVPVQLTMGTHKINARIYLNPEKTKLDEVVVQQVMFGAVKSGE